MLRAVIADPHLGERQGDLDRFAAALEGLAERRIGELVLLGDLFRALLGFEAYWSREVRRGLQTLAALRGRGARVVMVEGNRDFFVDHRSLDPYRDAWGEAHSFAAGSRRFLLEHGDLVNRRDRAYRFWRVISKSRAARLGARLLPRPIARRIVDSTEARLARTNFAFRRALPEDDLAAAARRHFEAGVDVVLWGHFHRPWSLRSGQREAHVVPSWGETGCVVVVSEDGAPS